MYILGLFIRVEILSLVFVLLAQFVICLKHSVMGLNLLEVYVVGYFSFG